MCKLIVRMTELNICFQVPYTLFPVGTERWKFLSHLNVVPLSSLL